MVKQCVTLGNSGASKKIIKLIGGNKVGVECPEKKDVLCEKIGEYVGPNLFPQFLEDIGEGG